MCIRDSISTVDADGVVMVAVQALSARLHELRDDQEMRTAALEAENAELRQRLGALEELLAGVAGSADSLAAEADASEAPSSRTTD